MNPRRETPFRGVSPGLCFSGRSDVESFMRMGLFRACEYAPVQDDTVGWEGVHIAETINLSPMGAGTAVCLSL